MSLPVFMNEAESLYSHVDLTSCSFCPCFNDQANYTNKCSSRSSSSSASFSTASSFWRLSCLPNAIMLIIMELIKRVLLALTMRTMTLNMIWTPGPRPKTDRPIQSHDEQHVVRLCYCISLSRLMIMIFGFKWDGLEDYGSSVGPLGNN